MKKVIIDFNCNLCNKKYSGYQSLWIHNKKFHTLQNKPTEEYKNESKEIGKESKAIKKYNCKYCNNEYKHKQTRWAHEQKCEKKNNLDKINNDSRDELLKKELLEIKNTLAQIINKNTKIHPKTLQKINKNLINNSNNNHSGSETIKINYSPPPPKAKQSNENKIIQSEDKKYLFDFNNNLLLESFNNKLIKYFYFNNQFYFKDKDVALMLDYYDTSQCNVHNDDKINISELFQRGYPHVGALLNISELLKNEDPETIFTRSDESGFHSIILSSKNEEAIHFKRWVTTEILPSIRKYGSYNIMDNYSPSDENLDNYKNKDCKTKIFKKNFCFVIK